MRNSTASTSHSCLAHLPCLAAIIHWTINTQLAPADWWWTTPRAGIKLKRCHWNHCRPLSRPTSAPLNMATYPNQTLIQLNALIGYPIVIGTALDTMAQRRTRAGARTIKAQETQISTNTTQHPRNIIQCRPLHRQCSPLMMKAAI